MLSARNLRNNSHSIINKPPEACSSAGLPVTIIADTLKNTPKIPCSNILEDQPE
jgi:hypothetical protein